MDIQKCGMLSQNLHALIKQLTKAINIFMQCVLDLSMCWIKYLAVKVYGGGEVKLHLFWTSSALCRVP